MRGLLHFKNDLPVLLFLTILKINANFFPLYQLTDGHAEMFGTELTKGKKYAFSPGAKVAAFTWQGCIILISFPNHMYHQRTQKLKIVHNKVHQEQM